MSKTRRTKMRDAVAYLQRYMNTYSDQPRYEEYQTDTLINDVLYGLGVAIEEIDGAHYQFADGFDRFKARLVEHLEHELIKPAQNPPPRSANGLEPQGGPL